MELFERGMSMKKILFLSLIVVSFFFVSINEVFGMSDPSAVYCEELGYKFKIMQTENGEEGICVFYENTTATENVTENSTEITTQNITENSIYCDSWEFLKGECGKEYSYCVKEGYDVETVSDGKNSFSPDYAVCVPRKISYPKNSPLLKEGKMAETRIAVTDLINLREKLLGEEYITTQEIAGTKTSIESSVREGENTEKSLEIKGASSSSLPTTFDWRNKDGTNWLTPVRQQGCGDCWAHAAIGGVEAKIKIARNDPKFDVDLSEQYIVSCSGAGSCNGGNEAGAVGYVKSDGVVDESCFPYTASNNVCSNRCSMWNKRLWKIDDKTTFNSLTDEEIKTYLIEKGPLPAGLFWDGEYDGDVYRCNENDPNYPHPRTGHAIVIVGYNDIGGYWIVKNSWGVGQGDGGYNKVGYGECDLGDWDVTYIDLSELPSEDVKATEVQTLTGSKSGKLEDTSYKDGVYMTFSEDCYLFGCNGLDSRFTFDTPTSSNINSINLIGYHRARWEGGFSISYWDENSNQWSNLGSVPDSKWYLMKYNICNSKSECAKYISSGKVQIKYYHPSCSWCDTDYVDVDWLYLEVGHELYCSAYTNNANMEYISRVSLNWNEKTSGSSVYSDFTDTVLTTLSKGNSYTLYVDGHTTGSYLEYAKAWIDFNNDKSFTNDEEIDLGSYTFNGTHTFSETFSIPEDAVTTEVRMRVYLKYGGSPTACENANYGEVEDYKVNIISDTTPPSVWISDYGVGCVTAGNTAIIRANVYDASGVSSVYADIESPDENVLGTVQLYDDGSHNDGNANDGIYGNSWATSLNKKDYYIDFTATDNFGNTETYDNLDRFTTVPFLPSSKILLVDNSMYTSYINYYKNSLASNGYSYDLWDFDLRGEIDYDTINSFKLCIWSSPFWKVPNSDQQSILINYLNNGGRLFISGQDLGFNLNYTNFYHDYLHANYIQDDTNLYALNGVAGDPITDGINIDISGGDGANNQWYPDEIDSILPAGSIFFYDSSSYAKETSLAPQEFPPYMEREFNKTKEYGVNGILSSGAGALKVDTGTYKVVYFSFGFEAINNANDRNLVMNRVVKWLVDLTPPKITLLSPKNQTYTTNTVLLNVFVDETAKWIKVSLDGSSNTSCSDCDYIVYNLTSLNDNSHIITVYARDYEGNENSTNVTFKVLTQLFEADDPIKGSNSAPVAMIEFGDFQCPFCGKFFSETLPQIEENYIKTGKVKFVYRDFPLDFHQYAEKAAEAAECAHEQGKFWEYHDKLFNNQQALDVTNLKKYAKDLGLNSSEFDDCLDSGKMASEVQEDLQDGTALGISGVPSFFINGIPIGGAQPYSSFQQIIDEELSKTPLTIHFPLNITYDNRKILVNVTSNQKVKYMFASLNGERFSKICSDCDSDAYTDYAREGSNELVIKATNYDDTSTNTSVVFSVDTKKPSINKVEPKNKEYSKGLMNFTIKYTEDNLKDISIFYGASAFKEFIIPDCPSGRNKECSAEIDLSSYDGKQVQYYVVVRDQVHARSSSNRTIFVDNTKPVIQPTSPENKIYDVRSVRLNVSVSEKVKLEKSTDGSRFTTLCSNCDSYDRTVSFNEGLHTLTIRATDKAGNEAYWSVIFWTGKRLLTLTMGPVTGISVYNSSASTGYSLVSGLNGLEISVDAYGKAYLLFNATPNSNTFDGIFSWTAYYDATTGRIIQATAPIRPSNGDLLFQFWLPCGEGATCILNASFSNTTLISNMGIYNLTQKQVGIAYNNKTAASSYAVPELILGAKAAKAESTDIQASIKGKLTDIGLESYDVSTDLGIVVVRPRSNANVDKIVLKMPF